MFTLSFVTCMLLPTGEATDCDVNFSDRFWPTEASCYINEMPIFVQHIRALPPGVFVVKGSAICDAEA